MSRTAERWWVRSFARWIARVESVQGQLNLFFTAMSGVSLASGALKYLGAPLWAIVLFVALLGVCITAYTYYYSEGGVWNQKNRDSVDLSTNFAGPTMRIDDELIGAAVFAAVHGRAPDPEEQETIAEAVDRPWQEYRDGVDITSDQ